MCIRDRFNESKPGWFLTKVSQTKDGKVILQAGLTAALHSLLVPTCSTFRVWKGVPSLAALKGFVHSELVVWHPESWQSVDDIPHTYSAEPGDLDRSVPSKVLAQELCSSNGEWQDVCFVQFFGVPDIKSSQ